MLGKLFKYLTRSLLAIVLLFVCAFVFVFFSPRPPLTIDPNTLAGDGSRLNYCDLPVLDGQGKQATDIAKGNTPGCAYSHVSGNVGHVERVEQCGARVVVTAAGIIHDSGPNSTGGFNSNDTEGAVLFSLGDKDYCPRTSAGMFWNDKILDFKVLGWGPVVVRRYMKDKQLVWEYADGSTTHMERLCELPPEHKVPAPRGRRLKLF